MRAAASGGGGGGGGPRHICPMPGIGGQPDGGLHWAEGGNGCEVGDGIAAAGSSVRSHTREVVIASTGRSELAAPVLRGRFGVREEDIPLAPSPSRSVGIGSLQKSGEML